jgi:drug/metabolite transporter (DMT)-like permease
MVAAPGRATLPVAILYFQSQASGRWQIFTAGIPGSREKMVFPWENLGSLPDHSDPQGPAKGIMHMKPEILTALIAVTGFILFSLGDAGIKFSTGAYSPLQVAAGVMAFGLIPSLGHMWKEGTIRSPWPNKPGLVALACIFTPALALCVFYSFANMPMALVYAAVFAMPILTNALNALLLGETIGSRQVAAILCGFLGVLLALDPGSISFSWGHLVLIGIPINGAAISIIVRKTARHEALSVMNFWPNLSGFIVLSALAIPDFEPMVPSVVLIIMAVAGLHWLGRVCQMHATRRGPVVVATSMQYSQIIWGGLLGFFVFGEQPAAMVFVGSALIIGSGLYIITRSEVLPVAKGGDVAEPTSTDPADTSRREAS